MGIFFTNVTFSGSWGVEDVQAGVGSANVNGVALPIHAPHRFGEVAVGHALELDRLDVNHLGEVGHVPDVDAVPDVVTS